MVLTFFKFLPFVVVGLAFLFGGHYFLYRSFISIFNIDSLVIKSGLSLALFLLPLGFFLTSVIAHASQSRPTRFFYFLTASWLGVAINLVLAACFIRLTVYLASLAGFNFSTPILGLMAFSLAIIFSVYGFWNAFHPQVKKMDITIKNLPAQWQDKTIVQLSDIHLGHVHAQNFLQMVVDKTKALEPDLILITGDLFDGMDGDLGAFIKPLKSLEAKQGVFFVTGNHEAYVGLARAMGILRQTHIRVLNNEVVNLDGLQVVGLNYEALSDGPDIFGKSKKEASVIHSIAGFDKNLPSILMYHAPTNINQAKESGINLQLSGHTHRGQIWPLELVTRLIYGRYDYGLHAIDDFSIYTTNGIGTWGPPIRSGNTPEIPVFKLH